MNILKLVLEKFPKSITLCFAYGSGVKKQANYESAGKMIDIFFCVQNSEEWHRENISRNPNHYSSIKILGPKFISYYQENFGARCYFNTLVPLNFENYHNYFIKYGIITRQHLIDDLINWEHLYLAGRLQKPVEILSIKENDIKLQEALMKNLENAIHTALLFLPENFNNYDLFYTVANISYKGDFRMIFGENKRKVHNIVLPQLNQFYKLYLPVLQKMSFCLSIMDDENLKFQQDKSINMIKIHLENLPKELRKKLLNNYGNTNYQNEENLILNSIANDENYQILISKSLAEIIRKSSILQSLKNIPSAGLKKSLAYSWQKALKTFS